MARVLSWLKSRATVDEPVGQQERWWWPGMEGQEWGWGEMISRNILSVKSTGMAGRLWDFSKGEGGVQLSSGYSTSPLDKDNRTGPMW